MVGIFINFLYTTNRTFQFQCGWSSSKTN